MDASLKKFIHNFWTNSDNNAFLLFDRVFINGYLKWRCKYCLYTEIADGVPIKHTLDCRGKIMKTTNIIIATLILLGTTTTNANSIDIASGTCTLPGVDTNGNMIVNGGSGEVIVTIENNNTITFKCLGKDISNTSGKAQIFDGFLVLIIFPDNSQIISDDTKVIISKNGIASMSCSIDL